MHAGERAVALHSKWKTILPFNIIYFSPGHFVWNYILTIYYVAGKKKRICVGLFGRAYHLVISSKLSASTDVAISANVIPAW